MDFENSKTSGSSSQTSQKKNVQKKRKSSGQWCFAINCKNNRSANKDISFFHFPISNDARNG